jgi:hypothetical protein
MQEKSTIVEEVEGGGAAPKVEENKHGIYASDDNNNNKDVLLWEQERLIRRQVVESRISGNFLGAFFVNTYSSMHIFVVYLISLESLLSIALSVIMTVCE